MVAQFACDDAMLWTTRSGHTLNVRARAREDGVDDSLICAGPAAKIHEVRGRLRPKLKVGALNQYGARSTVLKTL
jgi:hypothetical protein